MTNAMTMQRVPELNLTTLDGAPLNLRDLKGKPVLLNFFKSTCPWCQAEMPKLAKVYTRLKEQGINVPIAGVVVGSDTPDSARRFAQSSGLDIPLAVDADKKARVDFGLTRVPTLMLIDAQGQIARVYEGSSEQLAGIVEQALMAAARGDAAPTFELVGNG